MPAWIEWLFLDILGRLLCMTPKTKTKCFRRKKSHAAAIENLYYSSPMKVTPEAEYKEEDEDTKLDNFQPDTLVSCERYIAKITNVAEKFQQGMQDSISSEEIENKWKLLSAVLDRCLLYNFAIFATFTSVLLILMVLLDSEDDYEDLVNEYFNTDNYTMNQEL